MMFRISGQVLTCQPLDRRAGRFGMPVLLERVAVHISWWGNNEKHLCQGMSFAIY